MPNYLQFFPRPLLVDLCENEVLPFIGSGFSLNAITPPGTHMPLIGEIAACLNELMPGYMGNSPMDVISEFDVRFGRAQLGEEFYKIFLVGEAQPGPAHLAFARLPFDIVATTNVDQLLEDAYFEVNRFPQVVQFEDQLPVHDTADNPVELLKIHGDINYPNRMIWTELDYDTFVATYPLYATYLASLLIRLTPLFIGYSVEDYDLRMIWNIIGERLGRLRRRAYVIEVAATASMIERYARRGIEVINLPGERSQFGVILAETFRQLREFLQTGCPPEGVPPCAALGVPLDINVPSDDGGGDDCTGEDHQDSSGDTTGDEENRGRRVRRRRRHRFGGRFGRDDGSGTGEDHRNQDECDTNDDSSGSGNDENRGCRTRRRRHFGQRRDGFDFRRNGFTDGFGGTWIYVRDASGDCDDSSGDDQTGCPRCRRRRRGARRREWDQ